MKAKYKVSCAIAAILTGCASSAAADSAAPSSGIETVIVSAERRDESVQSVPATLQAFSGQTLADLNVTTLRRSVEIHAERHIRQQRPGPGRNFHARLEQRFPRHQSTGTVGLYPNTAIYLDEQSMQFPARNVDIYMVDMKRIEVLEGPQGTLFGGGAEAGALRYITNKPDANAVHGAGPKPATA